jgi:hypothetical protein
MNIVTTLSRHDVAFKKQISAQIVLATVSRGGNDAGAPTKISTDADNKITTGSDQGLYVDGKFQPDLLAYYILARD